MIVYHGTGPGSLPGFLAGRPNKRPRRYLDGRSAFCTTSYFRIAELFAFRRTPMEDFMDGCRITGVVLEFSLVGRVGKDYSPAIDARSMQDEQEIAVYNLRALTLTAIWRYAGKWVREEVGNEKAHKARKKVRQVASGQGIGGAG